MSWSPISEDELSEQMAESIALMTPQTKSLWNQIQIPPVKWKLSPWGDIGGGFWVVAKFGDHVVWYNDIEEGFNVSRFTVHGTIDEYLCNQDELHNSIFNFLIDYSKPAND